MVKNSPNRVPLITRQFLSRIFLADVISTSAEDFESKDDVVEAIGGFLQECDAAKTEKEIE